MEKQEQNTHLLNQSKKEIPGLRDDEVRHIILATLISADYNGITEAEKQGIIDNFHDSEDLDWKYILNPIKDTKLRQKFIELLQYEPKQKTNITDYTTRGYAAKAGV